MSPCKFGSMIATLKDSNLRNKLVEEFDWLEIAQSKG